MIFKKLKKLIIIILIIVFFVFNREIKIKINTFYNTIGNFII